MRLTTSVPTVANVAAVADIQPNPLFDDSPARQRTNEFGQFFTNVLNNAPLAPDADRRVLLGTFSLTLGSAAATGGSTLFTFADPVPTSDQFVTGNFNAFDNLVSPLQVQVSPVAEPAGLLAVGIVATAVGRWLRRVRPA